MIVLVNDYQIAVFDGPIQIRIDYDSDEQLCFQDEDGNEVLRLDAFENDVWIK